MDGISIHGLKERINFNMGKIRITRDSVCAGDSVTAPNEAYLDCKPEQALSDLVSAIIDYLPKISDSSDLLWEIKDKVTSDILALVTFDGTGAPVVDIISDITPTELFCRHYWRYEFRSKYPDDITIVDIKNKMLTDLL